MTITYFKAHTTDERKALNTFLKRHNERGQGSTKGYVAYYAARRFVGELLAVAKFCPLHTPQAAKFYAGNDWRHVYTLQRLAAYRMPENGLSNFLGWCLRQMGKDPKVWYVATYAGSGDFNSTTGQPHDGGIYRATNAVYCGMTAGNRVEAYILDGVRHSLRKGPKTTRLTDIPVQARLIRSKPKYRYCWGVGPPLKRSFRQGKLAIRMSKYHFEPVYQPRLLARLRRLLPGLINRPAPTPCE